MYNVYTAFSRKYNKEIIYFPNTVRILYFMLFSPLNYKKKMPQKNCL